MHLPSIIKEPAIHLIGDKCYTSLVENINIRDLECIKLLISKGLGIGIVLFGSLIKIPQIIKITTAGSVKGLSFESIALETIGYAIGLAYNNRQGNPFSTYGENLSLTIQDIFILLLILNYTGRIKELFITGTIIMVLSYSLGSSWIINDTILAFLQSLTIPISLASKIPQIIKNHRNKSTGQLSALATFGYTLGALARVFTTMTEVDDVIILTGFTLASIFNLILTIQMIIYWDSDNSLLTKRD
ncbi:13833_t:CDS:1 [Entrophospora sp. SA101]|nr:2419_t:CDS:1 [Entrophospora candida]CAH1763963.1 2381_t:CDS:1 [Entrophospora sp. SA101]CAG8586859.1 8259_t:CDS:1 [Entrophospora candida]CAJ0647798.1 3035_t:CDS:1 [Entrophospora sp. SA101]CAJ0755193.1 4823_t:CDS:1 [Entrophospora sp. SA101]